MKLQHVAVFLLVGLTLQAEDFTLRHFGQGPISLHTTLTPEGKGGRLVASATNDSGALIEHAKICVLGGAGEGCLFELWNTAPWAAGEQLSWNVTTARKLASVAHDATITELTGAAPPTPASPAAVSISTPAQIAPVTMLTVQPQVQLASAQNAGQLVLPDGTSIRTRLARNLSSANARSGDTVEFEVMDDIKVSNYVIIQRGSMAMGTVTDALAKRSMGRSGHLDIAIDYVRSASGEKIRLRGVQSSKGAGHVGAMTGAIVATSIVFFPAAPLFLFVKGKDTTLPKGQEVMIYVDGDYPLAVPASTPVPPAATSLLAPAPAFAQPSRAEVTPTRPARTGKALTNDDVLALKAAGFGDEFIVNKIKSSPGAFSVDVVDLVKLKQNGLSELVIGAMIDAAR